HRYQISVANAPSVLGRGANRDPRTRLERMSQIPASDNSVASERATGPPTPRLRRGLAVALRAKAEASRRSGERGRVSGSPRGEAPRKWRRASARVSHATGASRRSGERGRVSGSARAKPRGSGGERARE